MAAQPKRKISTRRKGMRIRSKKVGVPVTVLCSKCHMPKRPHYLCPNCGK